MDKLTQKLADMRSKMAGSSITELAKELKEVKSLLKELLLAQEVASLRSLLAELKGNAPAPKDEPQPEPTQDRTQALKQLEGMVGTKMIDGVKNYILNRATVNFEYENAEDGIDYTTDTDTEWTPESELADASQKGNNPVVSCYIPEDAIKEVVGQSSAVGAMGDNMKNPTSLEYKVIVKPGTYTMYKEIKSLTSGT